MSRVLRSAAAAGLALLLSTSGPRAAAGLKVPTAAHETVALDMKPLEPQPLGCHTSHGPNSRYHFCSRLLVVPEHKFAFCYVEKVACTQFNHIMNTLNGLPWNRKPWMRSSTFAMNVSMESVTKENGWYRGIFLRDPAERYLSAFQSKCVKRTDGSIEDHGHMCWPSNFAMDRNLSVDSPPEDRLAAFEESVRSLARWNQRYPNEGNPHYELARNMCGGLSSDLHEFDYVGNLEGGYDKVQSQVREMFEQANFPINEELLAAYFPSSAPSKDHVTNTSDTVEFYYQHPAIKDLVKTFYARDYEFPGLA